MSSAVVGAARVVFGADASEFDATARGVEGVLGRLIQKFHDVEAKLKAVGTAATIGITLPFAGMIATIDDGAGSYEAAMNRVAAALPDATADQLDALSDAARKLGPAVGKSADEAAGAIDSLARAGVSVEDILGGALDATLKLSAAGMTDAGGAAGLVTDVMGQFGKTASDLPGVMTQIIGVLDATKMEFDDFRLAIGQGGSIAAASGVEFLDFATTIAATSTQFASGADAGTSFKTYLQSLTPNSKEAERAMKRLGLSFFDAEGRMKPMGEQAAMLREKLAGLSEEERNTSLKTIFGADAARTAIGLMQQGREGYEKFQAAVANGNVDAKVAKAMEGSEQAGKNISNAWKEVKIAFGLDTGLLEIIARIKNGFAQFLLAIANLPVGVRQGMIAIGALGAAMGPLIWAVTHVGAAIIANFAAAKFGVIGQVLRLLISPISTILALIGQAGLRGALMMLGQRLLALTGPVGAVISLMLLFKDYIIAGLRAVWDEISATLGPPLAALFDKVQALFAKLTGGAIGGGISGLIDLLSGLKDFIGAGLTAAILVAGEIIERVLGAIIAAIGGMVDVVSGVVDVIGALLRGDFAGAWEAAAGVLESVSDAIIDMIAALVPEIGDSLRGVHAAAKEWLADKMSAVLNFFSSAIRSMVAYVTGIFPGVVTAAKSVYQGVKTWLVDNFRGIVDFVRGMVREVVGLYRWMAKAIGVDVALAPAAPKTEKAAEPAAAAPPIAPTALPTSPAAGGGGTKRGGSAGADRKRDAAEDAADRARMTTQLEIEAARLRGDREAEAALKRKLDLEQQIDAYKRTGLSLAAATAAATKDMAILDEARRVGMAKALADDEAAHRLEVAKLSGNRSLTETLERQAEIADRIRAFQREGLTLTEATARATQQQLDIDEARAQVRARLLDDEKQDREMELARTRGDSEARIRQLQREIDIRKRAREIEERDRLEPGQGVEQATAEWSEMDRARQTGEFRTAFKDGVRAALDGDLKGFISTWWKDRVAKGMEDALNSLADLFSDLLGKLTKGGDGGDILGSIGGLIGGAFSGKGGPTTSVPGSKLPGFKTGGSFKVGGRSGIDANIVAFRATRGEMVDIRYGNDNGPGGGPAVVHLVMDEGALFEPRVTGISGAVTTRSVRQNNARSAMTARQTVR